MEIYRIHGDNIVECERIANIIIKTLKPTEQISSLSSPSTVALELKAVFMDFPIEWKLELLPGFNKNTKKRWSGNIFDALKEAGSFFDETPDAIISTVNEGNERILLGIEFCSALQAGNQAWQRSARAFSTGRTGCPYLYIVDFVKYELDNKTRKRKNLRFPNAAVPYSYVNYSKMTGSFIAQLYTKSEEFDKTRDKDIADFNDDDFGSGELGVYLVKLMLGMDTSNEERTILQKNMNVVKFLANHFDDATNLSAEEWEEVHSLTTKDIVDYSVEKARFGFHKTIAAKSHHGNSEEVIRLIDQLSVGFAARDLPFGIIPATARKRFAEILFQLYPSANESIMRAIGESDKHLVIAVFKGFKPRGDDNRPDRGLLPLAAMLADSDVDVMSYIYGPVIEANLTLLDRAPLRLAEKNGLWRSILSLSNYVVLDVPVLGRNISDAERIYNTTQIKEHYTNNGLGNEIREKTAFPSVPVNFGEDDVDTGIHYLFTHILWRNCFEGMCNPPGGDWSGFSVIDAENEYRWLSLPRESEVVKGKRPDHILELFDVFDKPLLLSIESKEKSSDLESEVGIKLVRYIEELMGFIPSAKRKIHPVVEEWKWGDSKLDFHSFETMSAAAYLRKYAEPLATVFNKKCEILFVLAPILSDNRIGWELDIIPSTERSQKLKEFIIEKYAATGDKQFLIR